MLWCHLLFHGLKSQGEAREKKKEAILKAGKNKEKVFAMFEAVLGLSRVQTCFSPPLIHCHGTVWREAGGSCQLIHWEFDQKPRTTSGSISWLIAAVPYQINFVSSNIVNLNSKWNIYFQK